MPPPSRPDEKGNVHPPNPLQPWPPARHDLLARADRPGSPAPPVPANRARAPTRSSHELFATARTVARLAVKAPATASAGSGMDDRAAPRSHAADPDHPVLPALKPRPWYSGQPLYVPVTRRAPARHADDRVAGWRVRRAVPTGSAARTTPKSGDHAAGARGRGISQAQAAVLPQRSIASLGSVRADRVVQEPTATVARPRHRRHPAGTLSMAKGISECSPLRLWRR